MVTKARQLAELISNSLVDSDEISTGAVTTSKLAGTLDFSSKTMVMADNQLSGDKIHGGTISAFTSTGIDDNASSTAVTIDSSGNLLVGKTSASFSTAGQEFRTNGATVLGRSGAEPLTLNRISNDGGIVNFNKDGTTVGSIGSVSGALYIGSPNGSDAFIKFNNNAITPATSSGAHRDNAIDLGANPVRFKDLYLSGNVSAASADLRNTSSGAETTALSLRNYAAGANTATALNFYPTQSTSRFASIVAENYDGNNNITLSFLTSAGDTPSAALTLDQNRNVGIGTSSPSQKFHVNSGSTDTVALFESSGDANAYLVIKDSGSSGGAFIGAIGTHTILGTGGSTERMRIDSSGNVGIGTTSPDLKLDVSHGTTSQYVATFQNTADNLELKVGTTTGGSLNIQGATVNNNTPYEIGLNTEGGNVGIGISSPSSWAKLDILGTGGSQTGATQALQVRSPSATAGEGVGIRLNAASGSHEAVGIIGMVNNPSGNAGAMTFHTYNLGATIPERMRIDNVGNVGIGTSSPANKLHVMGSMTLQGSTGTDNAWTFYKNTDRTYLVGLRGSSNDALSFYDLTADVERMRINTLGNLLVGKTTSSFSDAGTAVYPNGEVNLVHSGTALYINRLASNGEVARFYRNSAHVGGISVTGSSTSYNTSSDYRLKENVVDLTGASARVNQLNPSRFNFISDDTNTLVDGFLAHEVADVVPEAITGTKDAMKDEEYEVTPAVLDDDGNETTAAVMGTRSVPDYQGIDQSKLVPLLTAALQEALAEIASLKTRVEALE